MKNDNLEKFKIPSTAYSILEELIEKVDTVEITPVQFLESIKKFRSDKFFQYLKPDEVVKLMYKYDETELTIKYQVNILSSVNPSVIEYFAPKGSKEFKEIETLLFGTYKEEWYGLLITRIKNLVIRIIKS